MATKPTHHLRTTPERHKAISDLSKKQGFKSVNDYLNHLVDKDAQSLGIELPEHIRNWGGVRDINRDST